MNRRDFLKTTTAAAAAVTALPSSAATQNHGRTVLPINRGWRYAPKDDAAFHAKAFDDSAWERVVIPHSNRKLPWHGFDDKDYEFVSTCRRRIRIPKEAADMRVFVDFEGAMVVSTVFLDGKELGTYKGGYTPFSVQLTGLVRPGEEHVLSVRLDSTERKDVPPFGNMVDYLCFGGIYREVALRIVPQTFLQNIHARTMDVLTEHPSVAVDVYLDSTHGTSTGKMTARVELLDGDHVIGHATGALNAVAPTQHHPEDCGQARGAEPYDPARDDPAGTITVTLTTKPVLWSLAQPRLYSVRVTLLEDGRAIDTDTRRIGFREARFTPQGFMLNGEVIKLHGLDRHQTYPWVGQAMSARGQRQDAKILRGDLGCNIVRTSHYPQSRHFLDACDELGQLVLEEIPGWQHIGDTTWQDIAVDNVRRMIRRDWNRPSVVLWGVRINESRDNHDFYTRTNALARALDATRQTGGIRYLYDSELLEDVFTMNDFGFPLRKPNHPLYLNTEFVGHTFPTKTTDAHERQNEHLLRHARVHDQIAGDPQYAGGIGWCAFDYTTHYDFGSGDRICYHGVMDIFRTPKPAAMLYRAMRPRSEAVVLEAAFYWAINDESTHLQHLIVCANTDTVRLTTINAKGEHVVAEGGPDRERFPHMEHPPFVFDAEERIDWEKWGDLKLEGLVNGHVVATKMFAGDGVDARFVLSPDATELIGDGADMVRVVLRTEDRYGNVRHFASDAISLHVDGPAEIVGDNPFGLIAGTGAVWLRTKEGSGNVTLRAKHPWLGTAVAKFDVAPIAEELA